LYLSHDQALGAFMGENYLQLVDSSVPLAEASREGARMVQWLQRRSIVGPAQREGDLNRQDLGLTQEHRLSQIDTMVYRPGPNYREACESDHLLRLQHNWLTVIAERTVFHAGDSGLGIYCLRCDEEQSQHGEDWNDAVTAWWGGQQESLTCMKCGHEAPLSGWRFDPVWGFGNLGFSFHNWDLHPRFIMEFEKELGRPLTVVTVHP
jgi:hypothetical protein